MSDSTFSDIDLKNEMTGPPLRLDSDIQQDGKIWITIAGRHNLKC